MREVSVAHVFLCAKAALLAGAEALVTARSVLPVTELTESFAEARAQIGFRVGVGASPDDVALREVVDLYFHVGAIEDLVDKRGVSVPLFGQGGAGVRNVLRWAAGTVTEPQPLASHGDVASHARHCASQYQDAGHVMKAERHSRRAAQHIASAFPAVRAVLGTGFPFYCMTGIEEPDRVEVPESIRTYTGTQADHFERKLLPLDVLQAGGRYTADALLKRGVDLGQTQFNAYEYTRWGVDPPSPPDAGLVEKFLQANTVDEATRDWPCHLCTHLSDRAKFPEQAWERDFMRSCLECGQTPYIPRAVGVLGSDIDLIALVDDDEGPLVDPAVLAHDIASWIDAHPHYFRHDTRWTAQLGGEHGPLDVFVTSRRAFFDAVTRLGDGDGWMSVTLDATVTWLPVTTIAYEVGKYFPLCMELLVADEPSGITEDLANARRRFAEKVPADEVFAAYEVDSEYLRQLASNESVRTTLRRRYALWADRGLARGATA